MEEFKKILSDVEQDNHSGSNTLADKLILELMAIAPQLTHGEKTKFVSELSQLADKKPYFESIQHLLRALRSNPDWTELLQQYSSHNREAVLSIARQFKSLVGNAPKSFLLHSNSQTVVAAFRELISVSKEFKIFQTKSIPGKEGIIQGELLRQIGLNVSQVDDDPAISILEQIDYLVTGADLILETEFINKVGTRLLASKIHALRKSFIVLADKRKFTTSRPNKVSPQFEFVPRSIITYLISD